MAHNFGLTPWTTVIMLKQNNTEAQRHCSGDVKWLPSNIMINPTSTTISVAPSIMPHCVWP